MTARERSIFDEDEWTYTPKQAPAVHQISPDWAHAMEDRMTETVAVQPRPRQVRNRQSVEVINARRAKVMEKIRQIGPCNTLQLANLLGECQIVVKRDLLALHRQGRVKRLPLRSWREGYRFEVV